MATRTREHLSPESWTPNPCRYFYTLNTTPYLETVTLWWSLWWSTGPIKGNCRRRLFIKFHNHVEMELDVIKTFRSGSMLLQYCRLQKKCSKTTSPVIRGANWHIVSSYSPLGPGRIAEYPAGTPKLGVPSPFHLTTAAFAYLRSPQLPPESGVE